MFSLFIDANVYLDFYRREVGKKYRSVLLDLEKFSQYVFSTEQIQKEVEKNRISTYLTVSKDATPSLSVNPVRAHFLVGDDEAERQINREIDDFKNMYKDISDKIKDLHTKNIDAIWRGEDNVSITLSKIFEHAINISDNILARAQKRNMTGRPPGKGKGSMGDEINWEAYLDQDIQGKHVIIVTRDSDYHASKADKRLNPVLRADLVQRGVQTIELVDNIASALRIVRNINPDAAKVIAEERDLEEAEQELTNVVQQDRVNTRWGEAVVCPGCKESNTFGAGGAWSPSAYGGFTWHKICTVCGFYLDTGESPDH